MASIVVISAILIAVAVKKSRDERRQDDLSGYITYHPSSSSQDLASQGARHTPKGYDHYNSSDDAKLAGEEYLPRASRWRRTLRMGRDLPFRSRAH